MKPKNIILILGLMIFCLMIFSCKTANKENTGTKTDTATYTGMNDEQIVAKISEFRQQGEAMIRDSKFTKKEIGLQGENTTPNLKKKWEKADLYYDGDKLKRIQLYPRKNYGEDTQEFYVQNGNVVFAFLQKGEKHEGRDMGEDGIEVYFNNGKIIKTIIRPTGSLDDNALKIYEAVLAGEVRDIFDVIKKAK
ncbi:MAG: hypothetical protein K1X86_14345 [Ignavibacteria bacterium]|nr:hypothetical protein [Ignavibacteria bacterium]